jgi:hypothetical protein
LRIVFVNLAADMHSRFLRALFQFSKRAAGEATKSRRSGVELVVAAAGLECREPPAEAGKLIWRQLRDSLGNFFDFHVMQYSILLEGSRTAGSRPAGAGRKEERRSRVT